MNRDIVKKRLLGSGGMADVFLAFHRSLGKDVALKILKHDVLKDVEYVRRFFREARITADLDHPNILRIYESNVTKGQYYIVTEFMDGGDFSYIVNSHKVGLKTKLGVVSRVLRALDYAHQKGVIHRDIKPSNILLGKDYSVRLGDFGIATALWGQESRLTATNELIGTMDYIAPEQRESAKKVDGRADIYSIGVIIYTMVTGRKPHGAFLRPSDIISTIPGALDNLVMKCLKPRPEDRYKSAFNLYKEIDQIVENSGDEDILLKEKPFHFNPVTEIRKTTVIDTGGFDKLIDLLKNGTINEKTNAREILLGRSATIDENKLLLLLKEEEGFCLETVVEIIGRKRLKVAGPELLKLLKQPSMLKIAAEAIGNIGYTEGEDELIRILNKQDASSYSVLLPLGKVGSRKSVKFIEPFMKSEFEWVRDNAVDALFNIGGKGADTILKRFAVKDSSADIRGKIKRLLMGVSRSR